MERKSIAYLIVVIVIASIALFSGCVEEENIAPMETPAVDTSPTSTPEQETVLPTPTPEDTSPTSTPEQEIVLPTPTPEVTVELPTLDPGYEWYQNDEFGYKIAYPKDWGTTSDRSVFSIYPLEYTSIYGEEDHLSFYVCIDVLVSSNQTESRFWESGVFVGVEIPIGLEELKEQGRIIEYKDITVNGKDGIEVVFDPIILYSGSERLAPPTTARYVLFTNDDLDYIVQTKLTNAFYDEYKDTFEYVINSFIID